MNLHDRDIQRAAKKEGAQEKAVETARNLLKMKLLTTTQIAQATSLTLEEVQKLASEL
jgi:predicted transposase YdaD